jgi:hypothetical protein
VTTFVHYISALLVILSFGGCVGSIPAEPRVYSLLEQAQEIAVAHYSPRSLYFDDPNYIAGGGASGIEGYYSTSHSFEHGYQLREKFALDDPAHTAEEQFVNLLKTRMPLPKVQVIPRPIEDRGYLPDRKILAFEFQTESWNFAIHHSPHRLRENDDYSVRITIQARLMQYGDRQEWFPASTVLWRHNCKTTLETLRMEPSSYRQLQMNNGALIKDILLKAGEHCAEEFAKAFLPKQNL